VGQALLGYADPADRTPACPVWVLAPRFQQRGTGTVLMHECIGRVDHAAEPLIVLAGHPGYDPRLGLVPGARYCVTSSEPLPEAVFMARWLNGYGPIWWGRLDHPPAFELVMPGLERPPVSIWRSPVRLADRGRGFGVPSRPCSSHYALTLL